MHFGIVFCVANRDTLLLSSPLVNSPLHAPVTKDFPTEKSFPFSLPIQTLFSSLPHYCRNILIILSLPQFASLPTYTPSSNIPPSLLKVILTSSKTYLLTPLVWIMCERLGITPGHPVLPAVLVFLT